MAGKRYHDPSSSYKGQHLSGSGFRGLVQGTWQHTGRHEKGLRSWEFHIRIHRQQEERATGPALDFWSLKAHSHRHTSFNKATPPNPSQGVLLLMTNHSYTWAYGGHSYLNHQRVLPFHFISGQSMTATMQLLLQRTFYILLLRRSYFLTIVF